MNHKTYAAIRRKLGTQRHVASLLGVSERQIIRRENGTSKVTNEAAIAIKATLKYCTITGAADLDAIEALAS